MKPLWIVPAYRHAAELAEFLPKLRASGLPVLVVDDGNSPPLAPGGSAYLLRRERNGGKGAATLDGMRWALARGFTHGVQIDADGQHSIADALALLAAVRKTPDALGVGFPAYGADAPAARVRGRRVTRFFVWLETGLRGVDGLCGCRVYPLARMAEIAPLLRCRRMGFDVEALVRWAWKGWPIVRGDVRVEYRRNGLSNFRMVRDNLGFALLHARLCCLRLLGGGWKK